jgi:hypothetical protein
MIDDSLATSRTQLIDFSGSASLSRFQAAVSLHAHTRWSNEVLSGIPAYLDRIPLVARLTRREVRAYLDRNGRPIDFAKAWWHPAVEAQSVLDSETAQVRERLGLTPLVSITDHDCLDACFELRRRHTSDVVPLSFEWTVPFGEGYFHLGVHNLEPPSIPTLLPALSAYTRAPEPDILSKLLATLNEDPQVLLVLNHPLWDLAGVGADRHVLLLRRLLGEHGRALHALEVNGYRLWDENRAVSPLAQAHGLPLISGGDRHGCAANSLLNLTNARTFGEFVREIRERRESAILMMPEYRRPLVTRKLEVLGDTIRAYPSNPVGQRWWADRITYEENGVVHPLSDEWTDGGPAWVRLTVRAFQAGTSARVLPFFRALVWLGRAASSDRAKPASFTQAAFAASQPDPRFSKDIT